MEDDIDYGALFGVPLDEGGPEDRPDDGQEPAAEERPEQGDGAVIRPSGERPVRQPPAAQGGPEDRQDSRSAEPNDVPQGGLEQEGDEGSGQGDGTATGPSARQPVQQPPAAQNQADAQSRAQYEAAVAAAVAKAQADAQRTIDEVFSRSGLKDPYTGRPITSKAEYDAYLERFDADHREQLLKKTGMSGEEFQQFVQNLPEVRKAREAQEAAEKTAREAREAAARVKLDEQIREIGALDPGIKSLEDLARMPTYPRFCELVQRGNTLVDAYRLANFDALARNAAKGARQAAVNSMRGKEHLEQTKARGKGAVSVPAEVREQYKLFNPGATDEEIQRHYQKNHKE